MSAQSIRVDYATSLLADILAASRLTLPRHEVLIGWLQDYLKPAHSGDREIQPALAVENLLAIHAHLVAFDIPASKRSALH
jgi:hypothetical protein